MSRSRAGDCGTQRRPPTQAARAHRPVLSNPANRHRAVPLSFEQFRILARDRAGNTTGADFVIDGGLVTTL